MDKKTLIGFVLIGLVMVLFMVFNQSNGGQLEPKSQHYKDSIKEVRRKQEAELRIAYQREQDSIAALKADTTSSFYDLLNGTEEFVTLKNNLVSVRLSNLGGRICSATLADYLDQSGQPVTLFSESDYIRSKSRRFDSITVANELYFTFDGKNENINTKELYFDIQDATDSTVTMRLHITKEGYIDFSYTLIPKSYMVNMTLDAHNVQNFFPSATNSCSVNWSQLVRQQEKGFSFEQRYTTLTYKLSDDDTDYLSETQQETESIKSPVNWIAYKNQFFSSIFIANDNFEDVTLSSTPLAEGSGYMKEFTAKMFTYFDPSGKNPSDFQFYFGPNHYKTLQRSNDLATGGKDLDLNELIYFGWPVIRWINRFFTLYLFDWLSSWGLNMGIVLLLLTIIVKTLVYPFTYKSFMSSAKMRALKPYIEEINQKYPKQEDAMKKQQETMAMYSKFGVSPMGGCLPMLVQMPIWIALFNFVPNAIELRQQSFLWANDLSSYDDIIQWSGSIPLLGNHLSLFCLLFSITNILNTLYSMNQQQQMAGQQAQQMKMMRWMMCIMPIIFIFVLNDYSAGLNYYYFVSGLISIGIYIYLQKTTDEKKLLKKLEEHYEANKNNPAKKSGMMAKMEALQKEQERRAAAMQKKTKK